MGAIIEQTASGLVLMVLGAIGTCQVWIIKSIIELQKDMDAAHEKLRKK